MDLTQIALGVALLAVSSLTLFGSSILESRVVYLLTGMGLVVGAGALLVSVASEARTS